MTGTTEETPVVAPKVEEVVKLSNSYKEACVLTRSELVTHNEKLLFLFFPLLIFYVMCRPCLMYIKDDQPKMTFYNTENF